MKATFSVNLHDHDGDVYEKCILIHLEDTKTILKLKDIKQLNQFISELTKIKKELKSSYRL